MITILLEQIIQLLTGWIEKFNNHAEAVENSLDTLNDTAADIETNTDPIPDIRDNTGAVITPINNIKTNTDTIAANTTTTASNTTIIKNNIGTIATNTGSAAAFAEDCANNTLDIKDKVTTMASDTTQLRADSTNIAADVSSINHAIGYYVANTLVTEDSEGDICNFDTDLEDYLQKAIVEIPADAGGISNFKVSKMTKNVLSMPFVYQPADNIADMFFIKKGTYRFSFTPTTATSWRLFIRLKDLNGNNLSDEAHKPEQGTSWRIGDYWLSGANSTATSYQINIVDDCYIRIAFGYGDTTNITVFNDVQLEVGTTKTSFVANNSQDYSVSFGSSVTDGATVDLLSGMVIIHTTPETFASIIPIAIRTYKGVNNIYSDSGSMEVTYRETLKHYLDKNNQ